MRRTWCKRGHVRSLPFHVPLAPIAGIQVHYPAYDPTPETCHLSNMLVRSLVSLCRFSQPKMRIANSSKRAASDFNGGDRCFGKPQAGSKSCPLVLSSRILPHRISHPSSAGLGRPSESLLQDIETRYFRWMWMGLWKEPHCGVPAPSLGAAIGACIFPDLFLHLLPLVEEWCWVCRSRSHWMPLLPCTKGYVE